jgi:hypothetical protein
MPVGTVVLVVVLVVVVIDVVDVGVVVGGELVGGLVAEVAVVVVVAGGGEGRHPTRPITQTIPNSPAHRFISVLLTNSNPLHIVHHVGPSESHQFLNDLSAEEFVFLNTEFSKVIAVVFQVMSTAQMVRQIGVTTPTRDDSRNLTGGLERYFFDFATTCHSHTPFW